MLVTQVLLLVSIGLLGFIRPDLNLWTVAYLSAAIAFFSASQDIVLDAYRRELLPDVELGLGNSIHVQAYRLSGLVPGALGLILADHFAWHIVFVIIALFMFVSIVMTLVIKEAIEDPTPPKTMRDAVIEPFRDFIGRAGLRSALLVLAFLFLYKLGDNMATALQTPFFIDVGFTLTFEYLGVVLGSAALIAFMARTTNPAFAATQLALFTALASVPRVFANAITGVIVEQTGWTSFFLLCTALAIPGMLLLFKVAPWKEEAA